MFILACSAMSLIVVFSFLVFKIKKHAYRISLVRYGIVAIGFLSVMFSWVCANGNCSVAVDSIGIVCLVVFRATSKAEMRNEDFVALFPAVGFLCLGFLFDVLALISGESPVFVLGLFFKFVGSIWFLLSIRETGDASTLSL